ncbi:hypothetical protein T484DRAFT_1831865, partial [Baffinella frigidus]
MLVVSLALSLDPSTEIEGAGCVPEKLDFKSQREAVQETADGVGGSGWRAPTKSVVALVGLALKERETIRAIMSLLKEGSTVANQNHSPRPPPARWGQQGSTALKERETIRAIMSSLKEGLPEVYTAMIGERDAYMSNSILTVRVHIHPLGSLAPASVVSVSSLKESNSMLT